MFRGVFRGVFRGAFRVVFRRVQGRSKVFKGVQRYTEVFICVHRCSPPTAKAALEGSSTTHNTHTLSPLFVGSVRVQFPVGGLNTHTSPLFRKLVRLQLPVGGLTLLMLGSH